MFVVIYDSTVPEGTGFGVYMKGNAYQLGLKDSSEILRALKLLYSRKNKKPRALQEFRGIFPRRVYKFVPEQAWVNADSKVKKNYVDTRVEITNHLLLDKQR